MDPLEFSRFHTDPRDPMNPFGRPRWDELITPRSYLDGLLGQTPIVPPVLPLITEPEQPRFGWRNQQPIFDDWDRLRWSPVYGPGL